MVSRNAQSHINVSASILVHETNSSSKIILASTLITIECAQNISQLIILGFIHITSLVSGNSGYSVSRNSSLMQVPNKDVSLFIPIVAICRIVMWRVPNFTEVVVRIGELFNVFFRISNCSAANCHSVVVR